MTPLLVLEQLHKRYADGTTAIHDLSLHVEPGEILTLVGPSGCGKSTLLRLIAGLDTPTSGRVVYQGQDITTLPAEVRGMGVVFQNYALFPHMTVAENIGFGLRVRGVPAPARALRVRAILEQIQLADYAQRRPDQLSGGQQQRVALGRALAIEPKLLLLDEPLTALDAQLRDVLRTELRQTLERIGITSIYVTHDQAEALSLGDRVVVLRAGRIEQVGTPRNIYQQPATAFVAAFVGTTNRLHGTVCTSTTGPMLKTALGTLPLVDVQHPVGTTLTLAVRPSDLALSTPEHATLRGQVQRTEYHGDRVRLHVTSATGEPPLLADIDPYAGIEVGHIVHLRVLRSTTIVER